MAAPAKTVKDVSSHAFVKEYANYLRSTGKASAPAREAPQPQPQGLAHDAARTAVLPAREVAAALAAAARLGAEKLPPGLAELSAARAAATRLLLLAGVAGGRTSTPAARALRCMQRRCGAAPGAPLPRRL